MLFWSSTIIMLSWMSILTLAQALTVRASTLEPQLGKKKTLSHVETRHVETIYAVCVLHMHA